MDPQYVTCTFQHQNFEVPYRYWKKYGPLDLKVIRKGSIESLKENLLFLRCCRYDENVTGCINISINNGELVGTNKESICGDPFVSSYNVTVYAKDAGHAVINFTLINVADNRYDIIIAGLCNCTFKPS
jgi:hypothetical protein